MRLFAGAAALAALSLLGLAAVQRGAADLAAFGAQYALERGTVVPSAGLQRALSLDGSNPQHLESMARWHEANRSYREALDYWRRSARLRPALPGTWAGIARLKAGLGELDEELDAAINRAARLGPWEPAVQLSLAAVVMQADKGLAPATRQAALQVMGNGLQRQEAALVRLAEGRGRLDLLCALPGIAAHPKAALRCI